MATPTFTTPTTWADGNVPTAAHLNAQLRDNVLHLATPVGCQAVRNANQSIATATWVPVTFTSSENWDTDSIHSTVTNPSRFTVPAGQGGHYLLICSVVFANNTGGTIRLLKVTKNGAVLVPDPGGYIASDGPRGGAQPTTIVGSREVELAAGDYVEFEVYQDTGGALNVSNATASIRKVSN